MEYFAGLSFIAQRIQQLPLLQAAGICHRSLTTAAFQQVARFGPSAEQIGASVAEVVQSILGFLPKSSQPLMEAGLDSLGAVELRNSLQSRFGIKSLPATLVFDYSSISAISSYLSGIEIAAHELKSRLSAPGKPPNCSSGRVNFTSTREESCGR